jgi:hypothetical protein
VLCLATSVKVVVSSDSQSQASLGSLGSTPISPLIRSPSASSGTWTPVFTSAVPSGGIKIPRTPSFGVGSRFKDIKLEAPETELDVSPGLLKQSNSKWRSPSTPTFGVSDRFKEPTTREASPSPPPQGTTLLAQTNSKWRSPGTPTMGGVLCFCAT